MLPYVFLVAIPLIYFGILLGLRSAHRLSAIPYRNSTITVFFAIFFFLLTFRSPVVGVDTRNYLNVFQESNYYSWYNWIVGRSSEKGFLIFVKAIRAITSNEQVFLSIVAAVILIPIAYLYFKESEDPILSILLFLVLPVFAMIFSGIRQSIAIALSIPAYFSVKEKKKLKFCIFVVLAMFFHRSAFILFLLYPIYYMRLTRKKLIWIVPMILLVLVFSQQIFEYLLGLISLIYVDHEWVIEETNSHTMLYLFVLLLLFCYLFVDENKTNEDVIGLRNMLVFSVILQCFSSVNSLAMRMNYYFLLFLPLLIPKVIWRASGKNAFTCKVADAVFCLYFLYYFLDKTFSQVSAFYIYPYVPFWQ